MCTPPIVIVWIVWWWALLKINLKKFARVSGNYGRKRDEDEKQKSAAGTCTGIGQIAAC
jgi:hypothetical protein